MDPLFLEPQVCYLSLKKTIIVDATTDGVYVFDVRGSVDGNTLACSSSIQSIKIYDIEASRLITQLKGHTDTIADIAFSNFDPHLLYSCSHDGCTFLWDTRQSSVARHFVPPSYGENKEMYSLSLGMEDQLLAVGSDPSIYFWDIKGAKLLTTYTESHTNEVSQVKFHPVVRMRLLSASIDELICSFEFDTNQFNEGDTFAGVFNVGQPVTKIGFFGLRGEYLYALTSAESLSLWNLQTESKIVDFGTTLREHLSQLARMTIDYLIDCFFSHVDQNFFLFAGNHDGVVMCFLVNDKSIRPVGILHNVNGHTATVRAFYYHPKAKLLITAGEDARICFWHPTADTTHAIFGANVMYNAQQFSESSVRFKPY
jgi:WD40 repeat protein